MVSIFPDVNGDHIKSEASLESSQASQMEPINI